MMRDAFAQSGAALPGLGSETRRMSFSDPFDPNTLELSQTARVVWQPDGPSRWVTEDMGAEAFAQIPTGEGGGSRLVWTLTVVSQDEITFDRAIEIILPEATAAMIGVAPEGCRVTGTDRWLRVGD